MIDGLMPAIIQVQMPLPAKPSWIELRPVRPRSVSSFRPGLKASNGEQCYVKLTLLQNVPKRERRKRDDNAISRKVRIPKLGMTRK